MKKFLIKLTALTIPFIILMLVLNYIYKESYYYNTVCSEKKRFESVPKGIQLANLGSSHGLNFDYKDFPEYTTYNFAIVWQHHKYNYYLLKQYIDYFAPNAVVLIPISYFDITRIETDLIPRYYGILSKENFPDWTIRGELSYLFPVMSYKNLWEKLRMNENNSPYIQLSNHIIIKKDDADTSAKAFFEKYTTNTESEKGEIGFQYNIEAVSKILDLCYEKDIVPVLVSTPVIDLLNDKYSETDFFETFYRFTDILKEKYPSLIYLDYSQKIDFSNNWSLFKDADHLNPTGGKKFNNQIIYDLKNLGLL